MLQLYFWPMACSLASRIALMEAGIEARYHLVHLWTKKRSEDDADFRGISPKGAVPVLVLWLRASFTTQTDMFHILVPTLMQGAAMAFFFIPLTTLALSSIPRHRRVPLVLNIYPPPVDVMRYL